MGIFASVVRDVVECEKTSKRHKELSKEVVEGGWERISPWNILWEGLLTASGPA